MIDERVRALMVRIAKGLPVVILGAAPIVLSGCWGSCPPSDPEVIFVTRTIAADGGLVDANIDEGSPPDGDIRGEPPGPAAMDCRMLCEAALERPTDKWLSSCVEVVGGVECTYTTICVGGRRPEAQYAAGCSATDLSPKNRWLTQLAIAELASVPAFRQLAQGLAGHGAPTDLVERANQSAADEIRHAQFAFGLAKREGELSEIRVQSSSPGKRSLLELALHNAREGCVREAYASIEAAWQAEHAEDEQTRSIFGQIARDEARHAELSLDIDAWARSLVAPEDTQTLDDARSTAIAGLQAELSARISPPGLGLPSATEASALLAMIA